MSRRFLLSMACAIAGAWCYPASAVDWFVAPTGIEGDGSREHPFGSLVQARDAARQWRESNESDEGHTFWLAQGDYVLAEPFELGPADSGTESSPQVWRALPGAAPRITSHTEPSIDHGTTLVAIYDAEWIRLEDLAVEGSAHQAIEVAHCGHVVIERCAVSHIGHTGIHLFGGENCAIRECSLADCARHAIRIEAGDRATLIPATHEVANCMVRRAGTKEEGCAAMHAIGVGHHLHSNQISDCAGSAIRLDGNDHRVEANEIARVCLEIPDSGAIYLGHDWTERGNRIERNVIRDLGGPHREQVMAIYLDDFASGVVVRGNLISQAGRGVAVGGGVDNHIEQNLIEDCLVGIQIDNRGTTWLRHVIEQPESYLNQAWRDMENSLDLYRERYPEMRTDRTELRHARGNHVVANLLQRCGAVALDPQLQASEQVIAKNQIGSGLFVAHWGPDPEVSLVVQAPINLHPSIAISTAPASPSDQPVVRLGSKPDSKTPVAEPHLVRADP